jgi:putative acetyltransferase
VILRREQPGDEAAIAAVHAASFARPEHPAAIPPEVGLVDELRTSDAWIPAFDGVP